MKRICLAVLAAATVVLSGCATLMRDAPSQQVSGSVPDKAKFVFMRTSFVAGGVGCDLFEVVNGDLKFIGQLPMGSKLVYETTPGDKVFMAYGLSADFMLAKVAGGKTYYAIVRPNWGTSGFYPTPIRPVSSSEPDLNSAEFKQWLSSTKLIEPTEAAQGWMKENRARLLEIYKDYWSRFQRKSSAEKSDRTMNTVDGR